MLPNIVGGRERERERDIGLVMCVEISPTIVSKN
jgi:hypothetical protein